MTEEVYTITEDSWAIQIGAFQSREYAEGFKNMLERELGKEVQITVAGDYYRVRILDLHTREEVDNMVGRLNKLGFRELWIIRLLARQQQTILKTLADTVTVSGEIPLNEAERAAISLEAFRLRTEAAALKKGLSAPLTEKRIIEYKGKYYRLETPSQPILDPTVLKAMQKLDPSLGKVESRNEWTNPVRAAGVAGEAVPEREIVIIAKAPVMPYNIIRISEDISEKLVTEEKQQAKVPSIALQVAIYHKESQALRAQKKIMSKLNLPVEIVRQWDYYHVLIIGFTSREETYQYYPELAGMGYPGITLIENYRRPQQ
jgi:hypothetical protein